MGGEKKQQVTKILSFFSRWGIQLLVSSNDQGGFWSVTALVYNIQMPERNHQANQTDATYKNLQGRQAF